MDQGGKDEVLMLGNVEVLLMHKAQTLVTKKKMLNFCVTLEPADLL